MRVGIDIGGTKIEAMLLDPRGQMLERVRVPTPGDYPATLVAVRDLVDGLGHRHGPIASVGVGMPGTITPKTGLVRNSNRLWMNGMPLERDLCQLLGRPVRCANDANCFAASEAVDGAGQGAHLVFGVIVGTGCGGGIAVDGQPWAGAAGNAGEWGHNPLPWPDSSEFPGPLCTCGQRGCIETWLSGPALAADHQRHTGQALSPVTIAEGAAAGEFEAQASLERFASRLARGLASVINLLDPDVVVLGGGMSNVDYLYRRVPELLPRWVFGELCQTAVRRAVHGDSSGVRGAAWLWGR